MGKYRENIMNINKTKYRYFMDNLSLFPVGINMIYTLPVPKGMESKKDEFFDRNYPDVKISNIKINSMINKVAKALVALGVFTAIAIVAVIVVVAAVAAIVAGVTDSTKEEEV